MKKYINLDWLLSTARAMGKVLMVDGQFDPSYYIDVYKEATLVFCFITTVYVI